MTSLLVLLLFVSSESAGTAPLRPAFSVTGRVVDRDANPIAHARITANDKQVGRTDAQGRFSIPLPDAEELAIEAKAFATRRIALPHERRAFALGDVLLLRAAKMSIDLAHVRDVRELSLVRYEQRRDLSSIRVKRVKERVVRFDGLEAGRYLLTARGAQPLQSKSQLVEVGEGSSERIELMIDRVPIRGYVFLGREPLPNADIEITGPSSAWRGTVHADADGHYETELWQVGAMHAAVTSPKLASEFTTGHRGALENGVIEWDLVVPDRRIAGTIVDDSGAPVVKAALSLESEDGEIRSRLNAATDANGRFEYGAARSGRYRLDIDSKQHLKPQTILFELRDDDPDKTVEVVLQRGKALIVRVLHEDGTPIDNAVVADGLVEDGTRPIARYKTSPNGEAIVRGVPGEEKTLYVLPQHGSFTIAHVVLDDETLKNGIDVTVPEANSALVIRARDDNGIALDGIKFAVRYNGEFLPPAILALLRFVQHVEYRTTSAGEARILGLPAGQYELWAYRTAGEAERLLRNPDAYAPSLQLAVATGTYEADLTFGQ